MHTKATLISFLISVILVATTRSFVLDHGPVDENGLLVPGDKRGSRFNGWKQDKTKEGYDDEEKLAMLAAHNNARKGVQAANMNRLSWDSSLEVIAQEWANGCDCIHNYNHDFGENLGALSWFYNETEQALLWISEEQYYSIETNTCEVGHTCSHYTQVVLAQSSNIGCGIKYCESMKTIQMSNAYFTVCNYSPATNKGSSVPYKSGPVCSYCDMGKSCVDGLCDVPQSSTAVESSTTTVIEPATTMSTSVPSSTEVASVETTTKPTSQTASPTSTSPTSPTTAAILPSTATTPTTTLTALTSQIPTTLTPATNETMPTEVTVTLPTTTEVTVTSPTTTESVTGTSPTTTESVTVTLPTTAEVTVTLPTTTEATVPTTTEATVPPTTEATVPTTTEVTTPTTTEETTTTEPTTTEATAPTTTEVTAPTTTVVTVPTTTVVTVPTTTEVTVPTTTEGTAPTTTQVPTSIETTEPTTPMV